jgi:hypothetical protein
MSMTEFKTVFGSLKDYTKGDLEIINDDPKHYAFSNVFDVANKSAPYEKVVVAKNLKYVIEAVRAISPASCRTAKKARSRSTASRPGRRWVGSSLAAATRLFCPRGAPIGSAPRAPVS